MKTEELNETTSALDPQAIDELFQNLGTANKPLLTKQAASNANGSAAAPVRRPSSQPPPTRRSMPASSERIDWMVWGAKLLMFGGTAWLVVLLLTSFSWSPLRNHPAARPIRKMVTERRVVTRDIEDFDVGMRSLGTNPLRDQVETAPEPDPATSRKLVLRMKKESGRNLFIKLLRSLAWIEAIGAEEGGSFFLDLPEMGAVGDAYVEAILPCPPIEKGRGNVVTGTFAHEADPDTKILSVTFANGTHIKGVTDNHPFYSVYHNAFVPVGEMREGDSVKVNGGTTRITKLTSRFAYPGEMLYNLETHNQHVYQVTTAGILVHNNCITGSIRGTTPNKVAQDILSRQPTWRKVAAERGRGWRIIDDNGVERMRYMYPQKRGQFPHEQAGYFVRQDAQGRFLDIDGAIIPDGDLQITLRHIFDTSP